VLAVAAILVAVIALAAWAEYVSWAGQLTSLYPRESLVVKPSADLLTGNLLISLNNNGPSNLTIVAIFFNETVVPQNYVTTGGALTRTYSLPHGTRGTIDVPKGILGDVISGSTHEVVITTAMGNTYPANVTWP
jgi:hypothetical protein